MAFGDSRDGRPQLIGRNRITVSTFLGKPQAGPIIARTTTTIMPERIPPPPPTQALTTTTFVPPPLDLSLTVAEIIDFHQTHSSNHIAYVYESTSGECKQITFSTWIRAIHRAGRYVRDLFQLPEPQVGGGVKPIISILANSGNRINAFYHVAMTHDVLMSRHDHICHHRTRNNPRRRCRLHDFVQSFCVRYRPHY